MRLRAPVSVGAALALLAAACGAPAEPGRTAGDGQDAKADASANSGRAGPAAAPTAGHPLVDPLLAAIASGDEAGVRKLVGDVGYIVATGGIVSSEDAFVKRVLGCRTESVERVRAAVNYRVVWACPPGAGGESVYYNAAIATEPPFGNGREAAILEFTAGRSNPYLGRGVAPPPPTPGSKSGG